MSQPEKNLDFSFERDIIPILPRMAKPARYTGGEFNSLAKPEAELVFVLCYPDTYEIGMSNLGLKILYENLASRQDWAVERVFLPWPDLGDYLRENRLPLWTLETKRPLFDCDLLGFSLQYELTYTNVLELLELGQIPLKREERETLAPLVVAGGPCAFNPAPLAPWIDVFVLGDGEESVIELACLVQDAKREGLSREKLLERIACFDWAYLPGLKENARRAILPDLGLAPFPIRQIVPNIRTIQDRGLIEVSRGCTNGCRFCHAGMTYRPVRERSPGQLIKIALALVDATGFDEISLASLSISDYTLLQELIIGLNQDLGSRGVSFSLPSLHVDGFSLGTESLISELRKSGLTFAVEAGDPETRARLNKPVDDEHLMEIFRRVYEAGWKKIKIYFMIGFPGIQNETEIIIDFIKRAHRAAPRLAINLNLGIFIPKPHTPLQWARQMSIERGWEEIRTLRSEFKKGNVKISWHLPEMSFLEGVFARGGEKAALLLEEAWRLGARFDAWDEHFSIELWQAALENLGLTIDEFNAPFDGLEAVLPWDGISGVAGKGFLKAELKEYLRGLSPEEAAQAGFKGVPPEGEPRLTPDCRPGCQGNCGVCKPGEAPQMAIRDLPDPIKTPAQELANREQAHRRVYRVLFDKAGLFKFVSHLDLQQHTQRVLLRSGLPLSLSEGFNPKPRLSFAAPAILGMETRNDIFEIELLGDFSRDELLLAFRGNLPEGFVIRDVRVLPTLHSKLVSRIRAQGFRLEGEVPDEAFVFRTESGVKLKEALTRHWERDLEDLLAQGLIRDRLYIEDEGNLRDAFEG